MYDAAGVVCRELVAGSSPSRVPAGWARLDWPWLCCSQVLSSHTHACSDASGQREGLYRSVLSTVV